MSKNVQFMHFRVVEDGQIDSRGGATVAYRLGKDGKIERYALAICSPNDNYSRAEGRNIAGGRLQNMYLSHIAEGARREPAEFRAIMEREMSLMHGLSRPHMRRRITDHKVTVTIDPPASVRNRH